MRASGLSILQYAKLTGIDRNNIQRYLRLFMKMSAGIKPMIIQAVIL